MLGFLILLAVSPAPHWQPDAAELLKVVVFGCHAGAPAPAAERDADVAARVQSVEDRCRAFAARTPKPTADSLGGMVATARWSYEQRLFAVANGDVGAEAARYVAALRPCYEWEGFHDCPEREAIFADEYLKAHPASPFAASLPLLAAHRWLCAAEGYEYEQRSGAPAPKPGVGLARARLAYVQRLAAARASRDPLIRFAAETLDARGACF